MKEINNKTIDKFEFSIVKNIFTILYNKKLITRSEYDLLLKKMNFKEFVNI